MTDPRIKREITRNGDEVRYVHSFCPACSYWHGFAWTVEEAYEQGERHLINVHDVDPRTASGARRVAQARATNQQDRSTT